MRKDAKSVVLQLDVNEEKEQFKFNYSGDVPGIVAHLLTAIVILAKKHGVHKLPKNEIQSFCDSIANSLKNGLSTE